MTTYEIPGRGVLALGDCFDILPTIPAGSVDMVLADLPYGTTRNKWDSVLPLDALWREYWRVCKPNAAVVLTAAQPFTSALVMSQPKHFAYDWTWRKEKGVGHLNAGKQPLRDKEDVCVFYRAQPTYNPQFTEGRPYKHSGSGPSSNYNSFGKRPLVSDGRRYPRSVVDFGSAQAESGAGLHPTQKPVGLFEYLIKTYTNPGDLVLDNTAGSGTTGVAAANTGRRFFLIERDVNYWGTAVSRLAAYE